MSLGRPEQPSELDLILLMNLILLMMSSGSHPTNEYPGCQVEAGLSTHLHKTSTCFTLKPSAKGGGQLYRTTKGPTAGHLTKEDKWLCQRQGHVNRIQSPPGVSHLGIHLSSKVNRRSLIL